jgi:hypothetical protein
VLVLGLVSLASGALAQQDRYTAVLGDGRRVSGDKLTGWQSPGGTVRLGDAVLSAPGRQLRWFRDSALRTWRAAGYEGGYVEFVGGDRITGNVVGGQAGAWSDDMYVPAHVVLRPASSKRMYTHGTSTETVRLLPESIKRIVFGADSRHRFQAGMLFYRDRRRVKFTRVRWSDESVLLLLKDGTSTVPLSEIAEMHMPHIDPWQAYYRELAVLSPGGKSRLIRIETTDGMIATGSESRFGAKPFYSEDVLRRADSQRRNYAKQIERLETHERQRRERLRQSREAHGKQVAALEASIKKAREAGEKSAVDLKARHETARKKDAAKYASRRKKLEESYRRDVAAIEKRVAKMAASQRKSTRKNSINQKKSSLDRALKQLEAEKKRNETSRKSELERHQRDLARNLKNISSARTRLESTKTRFETAAKQHGQYAAQLEQYRKLFNALPGPEGNPSTWCHMVQPAWSLEPLWVPFKTISMRWSFAPQTLPLSRVQPTRAVSPSMLQWRADRNSDGGMLRSGGRLAGWGFGVHAYSELSFKLPREVLSFQSGLGLDRLVASGGCVQVRVYLGSTDTKPVYESPLLIGSRKAVDTPVIRTPASSDGPVSLILQVDPATRDHPPKADPLNIRDKLDWLEPKLNFDPGRLAAEIRRNVEHSLPAWRGWTVNFDKRGVYKLGNWLDKGARYERGLFLPFISAKAQPLRLSREIAIGADDKWLIVDAGSPNAGNIDTHAVTLRIGDKTIPAEKMPVRQWWRQRTAPLVYSIEEYGGKEVKLELTQRADGKDLYWRSIALGKTLPGAYTLKNVLEASGKGDMQVPRGLGLTLQSGRIKKSYVLEALEVARLGGRVTFCNEVTGQLRYEYLYGAMIGSDWTGGDKTFEKLKDLKWLRMIVLAKDSGVSAGAVANLKRAKGEEFVIREVQRTPSGWGGRSCDVIARNRRKADVMISRVHGWGGLTDHRLLKAGAEVKFHAHEAYRYEAHAMPGDYNKTPPVSRTSVNGDIVWEIK